MKAIPNAREVARRAWSVRLMALSAVLMCAETLFYFLGQRVLPMGVFLVILLALQVASLAARFMAQKGLSDGD